VRVAPTAITSSAASRLRTPPVDPHLRGLVPPGGGAGRDGRYAGNVGARATGRRRRHAERADTTVRAVVSYYGLPDLRRRGIEATKPSRNPLIPLGRKPGLLDHDEYFEPDELARRPFGGTPAEAPQVAALMSPLTHVGPHCPPTLLLQGLHNHITSVDDVHALQRTLEAAGVPVVYVPLSAVEHAFDLCLPRVSPSVQAALYDMERFLAVV
jgi:acetyl esterase/lipase